MRRGRGGGEEEEMDVYGCTLSRQSGEAAAAAGGGGGRGGGDGGPTCSIPKKMVPSGATDASRSTSHSSLHAAKMYSLRTSMITKHHDPVSRVR